LSALQSVMPLARGGLAGCKAVGVPAWEEVRWLPSARGLGKGVTATLGELAWQGMSCLTLGRRARWPAGLRQRTLSQMAYQRCHRRPPSRLA
jgi:hypothetical protein